MNKLLQDALYKISGIDEKLKLAQENLCNPKCSEKEQISFTRSIDALLDERLLQMKIRNENK